jgi:hypothetical protein
MGRERKVKQKGKQRERLRGHEAKGIRKWTAKMNLVGSSQVYQDYSASHPTYNLLDYGTGAGHDTSPTASDITVLSANLDFLSIFWRLSMKEGLILHFSSESYASVYTIKGWIYVRVVQWYGTFPRKTCLFAVECLLPLTLSHMLSGTSRISKSNSYENLIYFKQNLDKVFLIEDHLRRHTGLLYLIYWFSWLMLPPKVFLSPSQEVF